MIINYPVIQRYPLLKAVMGLQSHLEERRVREGWRENEDARHSNDRLWKLLEQYKVRNIMEDN